MKITHLRNKEGKKLERYEMELLISKLKHAIVRAGFVTHVDQVNSSSVRLSGNMCSFTVDTDKLGYNARVNTHTISKCKSGWKRTNTPTWTQREEYNHIINNVLDNMKLHASIKSGDYLVRTYQGGRYNHWDMPKPSYNVFRLNIPRVLEIVPIKYANDAVQCFGTNAPFIAAVPATRPRYLPKLWSKP